MIAKVIAPLSFPLAFGALPIRSIDPNDTSAIWAVISNAMFYDIMMP